MDRSEAVLLRDDLTDREINAVQNGLAALSGLIEKGFRETASGGFPSSGAVSAGSSSFSEAGSDPLSFLSVKETAGLAFLLADGTLMSFAAHHSCASFSGNGRAVLLSSVLKTLAARRKDGGSWDSSLRETARAVAALNAVLPFFRESDPLFSLSSDALRKGAAFLLTRKEQWRADVYDLVYILFAASSIGLPFPEECGWLLSEDRDAWAHPGTTALIMNALRAQSELPAGAGRDDPAMTDLRRNVSDFLSRKGNWLISIRDRWRYTATTCLILRSLRECGFSDAADRETVFLIDKQGADGLWEKSFNTTCLALGCLARRLAPEND